MLACIVSIPRLAGAQGPPPPIPLWVVDLHATVPMFPNNQILADSRALALTELPGTGLGGDLAIHIYPLKWRAVTFGIGGRFTVARAHSDPEVVSGQSTTLRPVTERFTYLAPQISLNFGTGAGWSYLSGGVSTSKWSIVPDTSSPLAPDEEAIKTLDYGGGARWFARPHLAFSFDVRIYAINPTKPAGPLPSGPRTTLLVIGAGVSIK
jgi:hypothetical protein